MAHMLKYADFKSEMALDQVDWYNKMVMKEVVSIKLPFLET